MTDTTMTGIETPLQPAVDAPAGEFSEEQARKWLASNDGTPSVRLLAKLWGWNPTRVHRFLARVRGETVRETPSETPTVPGETPAVSPETPETPETPDDSFDWKRAEAILPARTAAYAYIDRRTGDLRIWTSDTVNQCDDEIRINAEDVRDFIDGLVALVREHGGAR